MLRIPASPRARASASTGILCGLLLALGCTAARADPPIRSAEDAACRLEAKARVFVTPNPAGLEPEVIGRRIYQACMRRLAQPVLQPRKRPAHRRHPGHRRY